LTAGEEISVFEDKNFIPFGLLEEAIHIILD